MVGCRRSYDSLDNIYLYRLLDDEKFELMPSLHIPVAGFKIISKFFFSMSLNSLNVDDVWVSKVVSKCAY